MGKRGGGKFGRRTVLQLEDETKKPVSYGLGYKPVGVDKPGASALGGLLGQYGDSDDSQSDGEEQAAKDKGLLKKQAFVASSDPVLEPATNAVEPQAESRSNGDVSHPPEKAPEKKVPDDVDAQLQDFLAEIDAMDTASNQGEDRSTAVTPPPEEWETDTSAEEEPAQPDPAPTKPEEPVTGWQICQDEGTQYYYYWHTSTNEVTWQIPEGYSQYMLQHKEYEEKLVKYKKEVEEWEEKQKNKPAPKKKMRKKKVKSTTASQPPGDTGDKDTHHKKHAHKTHKPKGPPTGSGDPAAIGPQLPPPPTKPLIGPVKPGKSEDEQPIETNLTEDKVSEETKLKENGSELKNEEEVDDDFIYRQLEEPVYNQYTYTNKKFEDTRNLEEAARSPSTTPPADGEFDIDMELEMALEQTQTKSNGLEKRLGGKAGGVKRQRPTGDDLPSAKKHKHQNDSGKEEDYSISKSYLREKLSFLAEATELSQLVLDKLDFLEVNRKGLSKLQVLLIQLQTRINDWKRGGLRTSYLVEQVRSAEQHLEAYEASAAPSDWKCCWHRDYRRYYYRHEESGTCQWEYPAAEEANNQSQSGGNDVDQSNVVKQECAVSSQSDDRKETDADESQPLAEATPVDYSSLAGAPPPPPPSEEKQPVNHAAPAFETKPTESSDISGDEPAEPDNHTEMLVNHPEEPPPPGTEPEASVVASTSEAKGLPGLIDYAASSDSESDHEEKSEGEVSESGKSAKSEGELSESEKSDEGGKSDGSASSDRSRSRSTKSRSSLSRSKSRSLTRSRSRSKSLSRSSRSKSRSKSRSRSSSSASSRASSPVRRRHKRRHRRKKHHKRRHRRRRRRSRSRSESSESERDYDPTEPTHDDSAHDKGDVSADNEMDDIDGEPIAMAGDDDHDKDTGNPMENSNAPTENSTVSMDNSPNQGDLDGEPLAGLSQVNIISKPAHFAAAPVLLRPEAPPTEVTMEPETSAIMEKIEDSKDVAPKEKKEKDKKKKKDKKEKSLSGGGLSMKKKGVDSMVQKWQKVQKEVEKDTKKS